MSKNEAFRARPSDPGHLHAITKSPNEPFGKQTSFATTPTITTTNMMMNFTKQLEDARPATPSTDDNSDSDSVSLSSTITSSASSSSWANAPLVEPHTGHKKVLVTGGAGFIGSHVADYLLARGDDVVIIDEINDYYDTDIKHANLELLRSKYGDRTAADSPSTRATFATRSS